MLAAAIGFLSSGRLEQEGDEDQNPDRRATLDEHVEMTTGDQHRLAQGLLGERAEHQRDDERRGRKAVSTHEEAENTARQHDLHIEQALVHGESAERTQQNDDRPEKPERYAGDAREGRDAEDVDRQQHDVAEVHAGDEAPRELRVLLHQQRTWLQAPHQESTEQNRRRAAAGDTESQKGDHRARGGGVVGRLGADETGHCALTELLRRARDRLLHVVGHQRGDGRTRARRESDSEPEEGTAQGGSDRLAEVLAVGPESAAACGHAEEVQFLEMATAPEGVQDLADGEQADGDRDEVDAVDQLDGAEGVAPFPAADVDADGADRETDERRKRAEQFVAAQDHDHREQAGHHDQEVLGRPEGLREVRR